MSAKKRILFSLITFGFVLCIVEGASFLVFKLHPLFTKQDFFKADYFCCDECPKDRFHPVLGWNTFGLDPMGKGIRDDGAIYNTRCAASFGDSFTYGNEVQKDQSYSARLAKLLGCRVDNYGVGGYGLDQAILKMEYLGIKNSVVIIGIYDEMLKRNLAASHRFYAGRKDYPKPLTVFNNGVLTVESPPDPHDCAAMKAHHAHDYFANGFLVGFPYTLSVPRVLMKMSRSSVIRTWNVPRPWDSPFKEPAMAWLERAERYAKENSNTNVYLFLTIGSNVAAGRKPYEGFLNEFRKKFPRAYVVDAFSDLKSAYEKTGKILAPQSHYNAYGNQIIAGVLYRVMKEHQDLFRPSTAMN